jgi:hypothetical protein
MPITHRIPKHPTDCDETLKLVLQNIVFCNQNGYKLVTYEIKPDEVVLNYEPYAS